MKRIEKNLATTSCMMALAAILMAPHAAVAKGASHQMSPRTARDFNPDPNIVEIRMTAFERTVEMVDGTRTTMWTYNGSVPGPTIRGRVGSTLIVHFKNNLPVPTTMHWHGVELPADMDGSHIAQLPIEPGGTFRYEFKLKDASTFWYHSHVETNEQVEKGLTGAIVVHDRKTDRALGLPRREHVLVLDDVLLDDFGQVAEPLPEDPVERAETLVNGRLGETFLVNGQSHMERWVRRGQPQRLRLVNIANSRFMRISIPGHTMYRIGGDGGLLERPIAIPPVEMVSDHHNPHHEYSNPDPAQGLLLTPGERADVVFTPLGDGPVTIEWHDFPRGTHEAFVKAGGGIGLAHDHHNDGKAAPRTLITLKLFGRKKGKEYVPPAWLRTIDQIDVEGADNIVLEFGHTQPNDQGDITFFVQRKNGMPLPFDQVSKEDAPTVVVGETRIVEVHNLTGGDHNFHLHGFTVQPIKTVFVHDMMDRRQDVEVFAEQLEVKDTVYIPRRPGAMMKTRTITYLAVVFDDTGREGDVLAYGKDPDEVLGSGGWLMHCHVLEHADKGMASFVQVVDEHDAHEHDTHEHGSH